MKWDAFGARDNQDILMACCWILPDGRHLLQAFPDFVCVNGTPETHNEGISLLTLSELDSNFVLPPMKDLGYSIGYFKKLCDFRDSNTAVGEARHD